MDNSKLYGFTDAITFLDFSTKYFQKLIADNEIPHQKTSSGPIFRESDLIDFQLDRFERAETDKRIKITEAQRKNLEKALGRARLKES